MDATVVGTWLLAAAISINSEVDLTETATAGGIDAWLYGSSNHLLNQAQPLEGLKLTIGADATFAEVKTHALNLAWYDREGVLDEQVTPFDGIVTIEGNLMYLHPEAPIAGALSEAEVRNARVRYDDGDTIICDQIERVNDMLVRTMSVVTDELYLDRTILIYQRATGEAVG